ncbi:MAG: hypothetical protein KKB50_20520 [Planctomycetes bacterium]|nr:hypothetical protein [Planctomycetota bacterium]
MRVVAGSVAWVVLSAAVLFGVGFGPRAALADVIHVDDDAPLGGNGATWPGAFRYVQDALAAALPGDEIRLAQGTYTPDRDEAGLVTPGDRLATLQLLNDVALRGGYRGAYDGTGLPPDDRDVAEFETILSGDLLGDDEPDFVNYEENSYHVVTGSGTTETAVLDGLTITGGYADGSELEDSGAGMLNLGGCPALSDCVFKANYASEGAAMFNRGGANATIARCTFVGNFAEFSAAAIFNISESNPAILDCTFVANRAPGNQSIAGSGAIDNSFWCEPLIERCMFIGNRGRLGGAVGCFWDGHATLVDCTLIANWVRGANFGVCGGGVYVGGVEATLVRCTFAGNSAFGLAPFVGGAGLSNADASSTVTDCVFVGNDTTGFGGGMANMYDNAPNVTNSAFMGNSALGSGAGDGGGGICNCYSGTPSPTLTNCILWNNSDSGGMDEGAQIEGGLPTIDFSCVQGWSGSLGGTGNIGDDPLFAAAQGGMWTADATYDPTTYQTTFVDTIANWVDNEFTGLFLNPDTTQTLQSLVVSNTATTLTVWGDFAELGLAGNAYQINDYHLTALSPCIDAGDPAFVAEPGETDLDDELRVWDGDGDGVHRVDMGVDEFGSYRYGDLNCDGDINGFDIDAFVLALQGPDYYDPVYPECRRKAADINGDGEINGFDIDAFVELLIGA